MSSSNSPRALRLTLGYAAGAMAWIIGSGYLLAWWQGGDSQSMWGEIAKGTFFVAVTAAVFHFFLARVERANHRQRAELEEAHAALAEREAHYRALFFDSKASLLLIDPTAGTIVDANSSASAFYGWSRDQFVGRTIASINTLPPAEIRAAMDRALRGEQHEFFFNHRLADGTTHEVAVLSGPVRTGGRELLYSIVRDITTRRQAERDLRAAVALNDALWHSSPIGLLLYNAEGVAQRVNAAAAEIVGATPEQLAGHRFRESTTWRRYGLTEAAERAIATGTSVQFDTQMVTSFGKALWLGATFVPFTFRDEVHLLAIIRDLSVAESTLSRLKLLESALQAAPSAVVISDAQGNIEWVNTAFTTMTGYPLEEAQGQTPRLLKSGRQDDAFYAHLWNTITRGEVWAGELQNARKDGSIYWEHMTIAPVSSATGGIHHYVAVKQDITRQKDLENQVARTQRLESIGLLAGGIAHDLNNVLAPILMAMELFKMRYPDPVDQQRLDLVRQSAERGAKIVRQVLTFARGVDGERTTLQPSHLLREVRELLQETLPRNITIEVRSPRDLPAVQGDITQLHQVIMNLAVNARDAMPTGGKLTLTAQDVSFAQPHVTRSGLAIPAGDFVSINVRDTGTGIAAGNLDRIFDPFFTTKPRGEGTGLGLPTVLGIVRSHHGGLDVISAPGEGTEFRVLLPAVPKITTVTPWASDKTPIAGAGRVVLLVDDEKPVREITSLVLEAHGFIVVPAADGQEAIDLFQADPASFDLVLLDLIMPKVGGGRVAKLIKASRPDLPLLLTSGVLSEVNLSGEEAITYNRLGDARLAKPFNQTDLLQSVGRLLGDAMI